MRYLATPTSLVAGCHDSVAVSPSLEDVAVKPVGAAGGAVSGKRTLTLTAVCPAVSVTSPTVVIATPESGSVKVRPTARASASSWSSASRR